MVAAMAEFQKVIKERNRMCDSFDKCCSCPLNNIQGASVVCEPWIMRNPEDTERIVVQWAKEHPIVTNEKKFEEVFGFKPATVFSLTKSSMEWLDTEYKEGDGNG